MEMNEINDDLLHQTDADKAKENSNVEAEQTCESTHALLTNGLKETVGRTVQELGDTFQNLLGKQRSLIQQIRNLESELNRHSENKEDFMLYAKKMQDIHQRLKVLKTVLDYLQRRVAVLMSKVEETKL
mmetsp:Transcript_24939/g.32214  ORF Transcript_24939/g.32214 Transcript_24939/m.32214 type:complete len:129 (-) Transcript_24939:308-694(-)